VCGCEQYGLEVKRGINPEPTIASGDDHVRIGEEDLVLDLDVIIIERPRDAEALERQAGSPGVADFGLKARIADKTDPRL